MQILAVPILTLYALRLSMCVILHWTDLYASSYTMILVYIWAKSIILKLHFNIPNECAFVYFIRTLYCSAYIIRAQWQKFMDAYPWFCLVFTWDKARQNFVKALDARVSPADHSKIRWDSPSSVSVDGQVLPPHASDHGTDPAMVPNWCTMHYCSGWLYAKRIMV